MGRSGAGADAGLYQRVERQIPKLARRMVEVFREEIPLYARLPQEQLDGEIRGVVGDNLALFFRTLRAGRPPAADELAELRQSAARRAEERVPLDAVLTAYHIGGRLSWQALVEAARPGETDALVAAGDRVLAYVQAVTAAVAAAYLDEQQAIYGEERDAHRALAQALLSGAPAEGLAARLGVTLAPAYLVLALHIGEHPDELDSGVVGAVAGRRKLRRVTERLADETGRPVLGLLDAAGGAVLVPSTVGELPARRAGLDALLRELADAAGSSVTAGVAACDERSALGSTAAQAREVLQLARRLERPPGVYQLADVLLEYQLTRASDALPQLGGLLDPLARNPDLLTTLEVYVEEDLDRRRTSARLHVHPNTLDYRVRRIVELTGLDPATASGLQLLGAALAARRLRPEGSS